MANRSTISTFQSQEQNAVIHRASPVDGRIVSIEPADEREACMDFVTRAAKAFPSWSSLPAAERGGYLIRAADILEERHTLFQTSMAEEIGAPANWAKINVSFAAQLLREVASYADEAEKVENLTDDRGISSKAIRVPCGVCLAIAPWNAPLVLGFRAVAAPLLAGNTVLLKGSDFAPRTLRLLGEVFEAANLPEGVFQTILTRAEESEPIVEALIASPVVRRVNFTGSTRVGQRVAELCAQNLKRPLLELGGQSAMVVLDDADIELAAKEAIQGAYLNQGQICMSTERLIVTESIADTLVERIEGLRRKLRVGDPIDESVDIGPMVSSAAAERFSSLISDALSKGAKRIGGGQVNGNFAEPTLLDHTEPHMRIYHEEVFGPALSVTRVNSDLEAITVANASNYGLVSSVFSKNISRAEDVAHRIHSGICHINRSTIDDTPHVPFGGMKSSGYGRFGGRWGIHEFTELRWITCAASP